jgi:hypothetical protein
MLFLLVEVDLLQGADHGLGKDEVGVLPVQLGPPTRPAPSSTLRQKGDQGLVLSEQFNVSLYRR